mmetsp:Transcript_1656/g.3628  ORF Transcript_1656/g.3628 Transcript_1656/m.3628 type:complete len:374 (+) Transcript_1656:618-1739(+)
MVEVGHHALEAVVLLTEEVDSGDLDVVVGHEGSAGGRRVGGLDLLGVEALRSLDQEEGHALAGAFGDGHEVVSKGSVCDPLLDAIDDVGTIRGLGAIGLDSCDVASRGGLGDREADALVAQQNLGNHLLGDLRVAEVQDGRKADAESRAEPVHEARVAQVSHLLMCDLLVEVVEVVGANACRHLDVRDVLDDWHAAVADAGGQQARAAHRLVDFLAWVLTALLSILQFRHDGLVQKLSDGVAELAVGIVVVGGPPATAPDPGRLGEGDLRDHLGLSIGDLRLASDEGALLQFGVLGEDLTLVQGVENLSSILACIGKDNTLATGVDLQELGDIVDFGVDNEPAVVSLVVLGNLLDSERRHGVKEEVEGARGLV